ncbi:MAG TPA: methyltransferase domain-containing protein, partial [Acidimicrobiales bacterium]|nr:methyltransferase domain-containing protein [Acidimicrobiales bacterium]
MTDAPFDADAFNAFEATGWEQRARAYHRFLAPITARVINALFEAAGLRAGHRVLDVGTGPGDAAAAAAVRGATAVGVDVAEAMLALARAAHPGVEFHRAGAEDLPFEPASFDVVVGNFVILHVGRPEAAAAEVARVLAPGGRVALSTWDTPGQAAFPGI